MVKFKIGKETWVISQCGLFVRPYRGGWYALSMFKPEFKMIAMQAWQQAK